jgi:hypothetical protein
MDTPPAAMMTPARSGPTMRTSVVTEEERTMALERSWRPTIRLHTAADQRNDLAEPAEAEVALAQGGEGTERQPVTAC